MSHLYSVGALVDVAPVTRVGRPNSAGGRAYIVRRSSSPSSVAESFDVEYIVPKKKLSKNVDPERLSPATIETVARRRPRSASDVSSDVARPSLLSQYHRASQQLMSITPSPPKRQKNTPKNLVTTAILLDRNRQRDQSKSHPILVYLQRNNSDKGYLRRNDAKAAGRPVPKEGSHMSTEEKTNLLLLRNALSSVESTTSLLAHAFGVSSRQIQRLDKKAGTDLQRKTRSDAGSNLLTSTKLQDNWFSPLNCYKKSHRRSTIANTLLDTGADDSDRNLKEQWDTMTPQQQKPYVDMSEAQKKRAPFLIGEIQTALQTTGGYCTWRQLETYLADSSDGISIVSRETIRKIIMGLEDSTYVSTKLFPALTKAHIIKRLLWCQQFWIFWDSARLIRKRVLLVHMDEKWFYGIVIRKNNKYIPFLGMEQPGQVSVHHKNYVNKTMGLVDSGYLPDDYNNIAAGGRGFHGKVMRAGHMVECETTTYRRVTDANGRITYPKTAGNENRIQGQLYFEPAEVTANTREVKRGKKTKRKFSLQHDYWPVIFNYWEALCRRLRYENPGQDFVVLYQWDGAGPHEKKELQAWLVGAFRERGWIWRQQASQSPHLQVHDTSIFPMLSKYVSNLQSLGSGSRVVDNDELWRLIQQAYYQQTTPETIARAFAHHVQIVNAMYGCNGGDEYHRNGGLHCGVRKAYAPKYRLVDGQPIGDPIGVELIETPEEATQQRLRYERPTTEELDAAAADGYGELFNRSQLEFLHNNLPDDSAEYLLATEALHGLESS